MGWLVYLLVRLTKKFKRNFCLKGLRIRLRDLYVLSIYICEYIKQLGLCVLYFDMLLLSWYFSLSLMPKAPELQITGGWESNLEPTSAGALMECHSDGDTLSPDQVLADVESMW